MTLLNTADTLNLGALEVDAAYVGATKVWPVLRVSGVPVTVGFEYENALFPSSYAGFTVSADRGVPPYTYSVSGALPSGITLDSSTGTMSGMPATGSVGAYPNIIVQVTDSVGAVASLPAFTLTIIYKDPYYNNVKFLLDYDAADGVFSFVDQKFGVPMQNVGNAQHDTGVAPPYGSSSFLFDGGDGVKLPDSPNWDLGLSTFTIDFTVRPTDLTGTRFWLSQWLSVGDLAWVFYQNNDTVVFNVSTTGSDNLADVVSPAGALVANVWSRWRLDFDSVKYRLYKDGVMVASSVTLRTIHASSNSLCVGSNSAVSGFYFIGNCRGIRLTTGIARTASDTGYAPVNRAFPVN